jgi:hypothetical protein
VGAQGHYRAGVRTLRLHWRARAAATGEELGCAGLRVCVRWAAALRGCAAGCGSAGCGSALGPGGLGWPGGRPEGELRGNPKIVCIHT